MKREGPRRRLLAVTGFVGSALLLAACSHAPASMAAQVRAWANNAGYSSDVAQISSDLVSLQSGLKLHELPQLRTECEGFGVDVETLYGELTTPDQTITNELGSSLSGMYQASLDCYEAHSFHSASFLAYQRLLKSSLVTYDAALRRLAADGVN